MIPPLWMSLLSFGLRNWKYILIVLALMSAGFYAAWQIQGIRVEKLKVEVSRLQADVAACQNANATNQETIKNLKSEVEGVNKLCSSRLKAKDNLIGRFRYIDGLKTKAVEIKSDEKNVSAAVDDPVLHELNRLFIDKADSKD